MAIRRLIFAAAMATLLLALGGCATLVANEIVDASNGGHPTRMPGIHGKIARAFYSLELRVPVGPPPASLQAAIVEPRDYGFSIGAKDIGGWRIGHWRVQNAPAIAFRDFHPRKPFLQRLRAGLAREPACRPSGTVILLPGGSTRKEAFLGYALDLANHGYRAILVDLPGQGDSSGRYLTYGIVGQRYIIRLIRALAARNLIERPLAIVGLSEGAVVALDVAAADPDIDAVIAVEPFTDIRLAVRELSHDDHPIISDLVENRQTIGKALKIGSGKIGANLAAADPGSRVGQIRAPVLYIVGQIDNVAPAAGVRKLAARTPESRFVELPKYSHDGLYYAGIAAVAPLMLEELGRVAGAPRDPACLRGPVDAPAKARYRLAWTTRYQLGNVSMRPQPIKTHE